MQNCVMNGLGVKVQVYFIFHFSKLTSMLTALNFIHSVYVACFMKRKKKRFLRCGRHIVQQTNVSLYKVLSEKKIFITCIERNCLPIECYMFMQRHLDVIKCIELTLAFVLSKNKLMCIQFFLQYIKEFGHYTHLHLC